MQSSVGDPRTSPLFSSKHLSAATRLTHLRITTTINALPLAPPLSASSSLRHCRRIVNPVNPSPKRRVATHHTMTADQPAAANPESGSVGDVNAAVQQQQQQRRRSSLSHHPKRLIFAPGDLPASHPASPAVRPTTATTATATTPSAPTPTPPTTTSSNDPNPSSTSTADTDTDTDTDTTLLTHPSRAHQFLTNPPLHITSLHPTSPFHQFHTWFQDPRLPPNTAPETCTLATASLPSGRVSARMVYLKELDERGWVVYSNWGSRMGKGGQVFGSDGNENGDGEGQGQGNRWAALTFHWRGVERQVRVEGLVEKLDAEESETYWRTRERGSQIGGWASYQSKVLWRSTDSDGEKAMRDSGVDDGREVLDKRVEEVRERFKDTEKIPLPPFWGGVRIVPESVEFWQGRKSRLHDRFRYVRVHDGEGKEGGQGEDGEEEKWKWVIERLSP